MSDLPEYVHYHPVTMTRGVSLSGFSAYISMKRIFSREHFDIVQYSTPNAALYASLAADSVKIPVRLYCQWGIRYMGFERGLPRWGFKSLESMTCRKSTYIEAESKNIREFAISERLYEPEKSCVVWNGSASGVDTGKFDISRKEDWRRQIRSQFGIPSDAIVFSFCGRLTADKGINELLAAFLDISGQYKNARLLVMGGMDNRESLRHDLYEMARKSPNILFTGNVDDVERYYAASDVFVAPSYREGFGLVVIEAEAMGLPAIVSDVPGQIDAIQPEITGITCQVRNTDSLKEKMQWMLQSPDARRTMSEAAVRFAREKFEQDELFRHLEEKLQELSEDNR